MNAEYIHYGDNYFSEEWFQPISNRGWGYKPLGGLWASPVDTEYGWREWVKDNDFPCKLERWFKFTLKENARVLKITNTSQLDELPQFENIYSDIGKCIDFEKLSLDYDAMIVLISTDHRLYYDLYGWDVDSILVMNSDVIEFIDSSR